MTRIGESERTTTSSATTSLVSTVPRLDAESAVTLASSGSRAASRGGAAASAGSTPVTDRARQTDLAAIGAAFAGSPESFLARIALQMRRSNSALKETGIRVETSAAESADKAREAAEAAAKKAAESATGFLGLGKVFDAVVKIASVVASEREGPAKRNSRRTAGASAPGSLSLRIRSSMCGASGGPVVRAVAAALSRSSPSSATPTRGSRASSGRSPAKRRSRSRIGSS